MRFAFYSVVSLAYLLLLTVTVSSFQYIVSHDGFYKGQVYADKYNKTWTIQRDKGNLIKIEFITFLTEDCCDKLTILETDNQKLSTFSGILSGRSLSFFSRKLSLQFTTDGSVVRQGFLLKYWDEGCTDSNPTQSEISHSHIGYADGLPYENHLNCTWELSVPKQHLGIQLVFHDFNLEPSYKSTCVFDYVFIQKEEPGIVMSKKFCGRHPEFSLQIPTHRCFLTFRTDEKIVFSGFTFSFYPINFLASANSTSVVESSDTDKNITSNFHNAKAQDKGIDQNLSLLWLSGSASLSLLALVIIASMILYAATKKKLISFKLCKRKRQINTTKPTGSATNNLYSKTIEPPNTKNIVFKKEKKRVTKASEDEEAYEIYDNE